ncbi:MAG: hypothetical protein H6817_07540 [Phycisphaerales bacterium]|nr:hypothetical protein [Phycisphaerales bacterium]
MRIPQSLDFGAGHGMLAATVGDTRSGEGFAVRRKYLHWNDLRHREPPAGLNLREWWFGLKFARQAMSQPTPVLDVHGQPFVIAQPEMAQESLHRITQQAGGPMGASDRH